MKVVVIYYSRGGTTKKMAEVICEEIKAKGLETDIFSVEEVKPAQLLDYDGLVIGSPTYYGTLAAQIKELLDESVAFHGKLDGKVGAAFSSSANIGGGNETTVLSILEAMLIHGMVIHGDPRGDHYGPIAIGKVDKRCEDNCKRLAERFVELIKNSLRG
jgi:NAD(P)H dehydrogenase (quinone)